MSRNNAEKYLKIGLFGALLTLVGDLLIGAAKFPAGADFKRQFTVESYRQFFLNAGYRDVSIPLAEGRIPCAVAVMNKGKV